ncbi:hypothetical protein BDV33DRAFT_164607 [Aspergillus novoparasiticus]|uniref:Uncharacterized protein n=1 Tax=Aspergillus novoparasiticus TaxID=986946 RepID=A0A5N6F8U4_9EURO|nr:hypothetical protein BDV33DRAFT_164607 [Aspergillus novoparasiticus]
MIKPWIASIHDAKGVIIVSQETHPDLVHVPTVQPVSPKSGPVLSVRSLIAETIGKGINYGLGMPTITDHTWGRCILTSSYTYTIESDRRGGLKPRQNLDECPSTMPHRNDNPSRKTPKRVSEKPIAAATDHLRDDPSVSRGVGFHLVDPCWDEGLPRKASGNV